LQEARKYAQRHLRRAVKIGNGIVKGKKSALRNINLRSKICTDKEFQGSRGEKSYARMR